MSSVRGRDTEGLGWRFRPSSLPSESQWWSVGCPPKALRSGLDAWPVDALSPSLAGTVLEASGPKPRGRDYPLSLAREQRRWACGVAAGRQPVRRSQQAPKGRTQQTECASFLLGRPRAQEWERPGPFAGPSPGHCPCEHLPFLLLQKVLTASLLRLGASSSARWLSISFPLIIPVTILFVCL